MTTQAEPVVDERAAFRDEVRAFLEAHAPRREPSSMWSVNFHTDEATQAEAFERGVRWQQLLAEHGLAGLSYPVEYGGRGGPPWMDAIYQHEAARYAGSAGFISSTMSMLGPGTSIRRASCAAASSSRRRSCSASRWTRGP